MSELPGILRMVASGMRHLSDRQRVIAGNIANSETPGFNARTVEAPDFGAMVGSTGGVSRPRVAPTAGMVALGATPATATGRIVADDDITETKPDGNNVTLEDQMLRLGQVQADYATLTSLYAKQLRMLKTALGRPGQ